MVLLALSLLALLFWVVQGTTHGWFWAALMLGAIRNDHRRSLERAGLELEPAVITPLEVPALGGVHE